MATLREELPALEVSIGGGEPPPGVLRAERWRDLGFDFWSFDRGADALAGAGRPLPLAGPWPGLPRLALEVATRCQRLAGRRNRESSGPLFDRALALHRRLHDLSLPLVQADFDHSRDVWQWTLRLDAAASLAVQLAALFHDVERLASASRERAEPGAGEGYGRFKDEHARQGARAAGELLAGIGAPQPLRRRVEALIAGHERHGRDEREDRVAGGPEAALLADADALSFFSLNSPGYVDWFGLAAAREKVAWTLARMSPPARRRLAAVGLRPDVSALLSEVAA